MRKNNRKIKIKRIKNIRNIICDTYLPLLYSLFRIFFYKCSTSCLLYIITIIVANFHYLFLQKYTTSTFSISNLCAYVLRNVRI